jgi:hypothetical protein
MMITDDCKEKTIVSTLPKSCRRKFRSQTSDNIWRDEKQSREEAERRERLEERRVEKKE